MLKPPTYQFWYLGIYLIPHLVCVEYNKVPHKCMITCPRVCMCVCVGCVYVFLWMCLQSTYFLEKGKVNVTESVLKPPRYQFWYLGIYLIPHLVCVEYN